ncbi:hypothetical protein [Ktedonobacter racemifer]|uniref:Uncharacterized protein n=1 Tax=Ktedonobacter racemifer DSM 44963 TaxID=485913 RepID=D6U1B6_KTERA|nr:hypothetical protein [Ktedonobacter racemifer]EFH80767.1 hypothetical protein Krac_1387 [Ktedonobacter racemifer DSM 44963]
MLQYILIVLSLLVFLRYGLVGLDELAHSLSAEDLEQVCREHRLLTFHVRHGLFLPYPLSKDIRVGHVILDEIRYYIWQYTAHHEPKPERRQRGGGPRHWDLYLVNAIEQALAAAEPGPGPDTGAPVLCSKRSHTFAVATGAPSNALCTGINEDRSRGLSLPLPA